jgi:hypothetical protein
MRTTITTVGHANRLPSDDFIQQLDWFARSLEPSTTTRSRGVRIGISGDRILLTGRVRTQADRESAERAALAGHPTAHAYNLLEVVPS